MADALGGRPTAPVVSTACQAALLHAATERLMARAADLKIRSIIQFQFRDVATTAGFRRFRAAAGTPFNNVLEVRP